MLRYGASIYLESGKSFYRHRAAQNTGVIWGYLRETPFCKWIHVGWKGGADSIRATFSGKLWTIEVLRVTGDCGPSHDDKCQHDYIRIVPYYGTLSSSGKPMFNFKDSAILMRDCFWKCQLATFPDINRRCVRTCSQDTTAYSAKNFLMLITPILLLFALLQTFCYTRSGNEHELNRTACPDVWS